VFQLASFSPIYAIFNNIDLATIKSGSSLACGCSSDGRHNGRVCMQCRVHTWHHTSAISLRSWAISAILRSGQQIF